MSSRQWKNIDSDLISRRVEKSRMEVERLKAKYEQLNRRAPLSVRSDSDLASEGNSKSQSDRGNGYLKSTADGELESARELGANTGLKSIVNTDLESVAKSIADADLKSIVNTDIESVAKSIGNSDVESEAKSNNNSNSKSAAITNSRTTVSDGVFSDSTVKNEEVISRNSRLSRRNSNSGNNDIKSKATDFSSSGFETKNKNNSASSVGTEIKTKNSDFSRNYTETKSKVLNSDFSHNYTETKNKVLNSDFLSNHSETKNKVLKSDFSYNHTETKDKVLNSDFSSNHSKTKNKVLKSDPSYNYTEMKSEDLKSNPSYNYTETKSKVSKSDPSCNYTDAKNKVSNSLIHTDEINKGSDFSLIQSDLKSAKSPSYSSIKHSDYGSKNSDHSSAQSNIKTDDNVSLGSRGVLKSNSPVKQESLKNVSSPSRSKPSQNDSKNSNTFSKSDLKKNSKCNDSKNISIDLKENSENYSADFHSKSSSRNEKKSAVDDFAPKLNTRSTKPDDESIISFQSKPINVLESDKSRAGRKLKPKTSARSIVSRASAENIVCPTKHKKNYNVEETREFMRKQKEKRLMEVQMKLKESENTVEEKKKKLNELRQKCLQIVTKNRERSRSRSKDPHRPLQNIDTNKPSNTQLTYRLEENKSKTKAAVVIQSHFRGYKQRRIYKEMLAASKRDEFEEAVEEGRRYKCDPNVVIEELKQNVVLNSHDEQKCEPDQNPKQKQFIVTESINQLENENFPDWLQAKESYPYNFISAVKQKLNLALNLPVKKNEIPEAEKEVKGKLSLEELKEKEKKGKSSLEELKEKEKKGKSSLAELKEKKEKSSLEELKEKIEKSIEDLERKPERNLTSKELKERIERSITRRDNNYDYENVDFKEFIERNLRRNDEEFKLNLKTVEGLRLRSSNSDTSNNVPDLLSERGGSNLEMTSSIAEGIDDSVRSSLISTAGSLESQSAKEEFDILKPVKGEIVSSPRFDLLKPARGKSINDDNYYADKLKSKTDGNYSSENLISKNADLEKNLTSKNEDNYLKSRSKSSEMNVEAIMKSKHKQKKKGINDESNLSGNHVEINSADGLEKPQLIDASNSFKPDFLFDKNRQADLEYSATFDPETWLDKKSSESYMQNFLTELSDRSHNLTSLEKNQEVINKTEDVFKKPQDVVKSGDVFKKPQGFSKKSKISNKENTVPHSASEVDSIVSSYDLKSEGTSDSDGDFKLEINAEKQRRLRMARRRRGRRDEFDNTMDAIRAFSNRKDFEISFNHDIGSESDVSNRNFSKIDSYESGKNENSASAGGIISNNKEHSESLVETYSYLKSGKNVNSGSHIETLSSNKIRNSAIDTLSSEKTGETLPSNKLEKNGNSIETNSYIKSGHPGTKSEISTHSSTKNSHKQFSVIPDGFSSKSRFSDPGAHVDSDEEKRQRRISIISSNCALTSPTYDDRKKLEQSEDALASFREYMKGFKKGLEWQTVGLKEAKRKLYSKDELKRESSKNQFSSGENLLIPPKDKLKSSLEKTETISEELKSKTRAISPYDNSKSSTEIAFNEAKTTRLTPYEFVESSKEDARIRNDKTKRDVQEISKENAFLRKNKTNQPFKHNDLEEASKENASVRRNKNQPLKHDDFEKTSKENASVRKNRTKCDHFSKSLEAKNKTNDPLKSNEPEGTSKSLRTNKANKAVKPDEFEEASKGNELKKSSHNQTTNEFKKLHQNISNRETRFSKETESSKEIEILSGKNRLNSLDELKKPPVNENEYSSSSFELNELRKSSSSELKENSSSERNRLISLDELKKSSSRDFSGERIRMNSSDELKKISSRDLSGENRNRTSEGIRKNSSDELKKFSSRDFSRDKTSERIQRNSLDELKKSSSRDFSGSVRENQGSSISSSESNRKKSSDESKKYSSRDLSGYERENHVFPERNQKDSLEELKKSSRDLSGDNQDRTLERIRRNSSDELKKSSSRDFIGSVRENQGSSISSSERNRKNSSDESKKSSSGDLSGFARENHLSPERNRKDSLDEFKKSLSGSSERIRINSSDASKKDLRSSKSISSSERSHSLNSYSDSKKSSTQVIESERIRTLLSRKGELELSFRTMCSASTESVRTARRSSDSTTIDERLSSEIVPPPLVAPEVSLHSNHDSDKENRVEIKLKPGEKSAVATNTNEIHLKFEAELHLLNDFNESLRQFMAVEKSLLDLQNVKRETRDTQTSFSARSITEGSTTRRTEKSSPTVATLNYSRGSDFSKEESVLVDLSLNTTHSSVLSENTALEITDVREASTRNDESFDVSKMFTRNVDDKVCAGLSLGMFEQLIKDEDARIENLKTILKIREKALLDRTKGELAWLEIQKKQLLETGKLDEASLLKKKQRGILIKLQHEKHEMQKLKQLQKAASKERKTILKEQQNLIKAQLRVNNNVTKMKHTASKERRSSGPLKVYNYHRETTVKAERSVSVSSVAGELVYTSKSEEVVRGRNFIDSDEEAKESLMENSRTKIAKKSLVMREEALQKRRKAVEELLQWHQKLLDEERKIAELEMAASNIISQVPSLTVDSSSAAPAQSTYKFLGSQLNVLWENMTGLSEKKFKDAETYNLTQVALERFCKDAKKYSARKSVELGNAASDSSVHEIVQNISCITDEISELCKLSSVKNEAGKEESQNPRFIENQNDNRRLKLMQRNIRKISDDPQKSSHFQSSRISLKHLKDNEPQNRNRINQNTGNSFNVNVIKTGSDEKIIQSCKDAEIIQNFEDSASEVQTERSEVIDNQLSISEVIDDQQSISDVSDNRCSIKEVIDNQRSISEVSDNQRSATDNQSSINEVTDNQNSFNEATDNRRSISEVTDNQRTISKVSDNRRSINEVIDNQRSISEVSDNQSSATDHQRSINEVTDNQSSFNELTDNRRSISDATDNQRTINKISDNRRSISEITSEATDHQSSISEVTDNHSSVNEVTDNDNHGGISKVTNNQRSINEVIDNQRSINEVTDNRQSISEVTDNQRSINKTTDNRRSISKITDKQRSISEVATENDKDIITLRTDSDVHNSTDAGIKTDGSEVVSNSLQGQPSESLKSSSIREAADSVLETKEDGIPSEVPSEVSPEVKPLGRNPSLEKDAKNSQNASVKQSIVVPADKVIEIESDHDEDSSRVTDHLGEIEEDDNNPPKSQISEIEEDDDNRTKSHFSEIEENDSNRTKSYFKEIKQGENNSIVRAKSQLREVKQEDDDSTTKAKSRISEVEQDNNNSTAKVKPRLSEIGLEDNSTARSKSLVHEVERDDNNSTARTKSQLHEVKGDDNNSISAKSHLCEVEPDDNNSTARAKSQFHKIQQEDNNSLAKTKSRLCEIENEDDNSRAKKFEEIVSEKISSLNDVEFLDINASIRVIERDDKKTSNKKDSLKDNEVDILSMGSKNDSQSLIKTETSSNNKDLSEVEVSDINIKSSIRKEESPSIIDSDSKDNSSPLKDTEVNTKSSNGLSSSKNSVFIIKTNEDLSSDVKEKSNEGLSSIKHSDIDDLSSLKVSHVITKSNEGLSSLKHSDVEDLSSLKHSGIEDLSSLKASNVSIKSNEGLSSLKHSSIEDLYSFKAPDFNVKSIESLSSLKHSDINVRSIEGLSSLKHTDGEDLSSLKASDVQVKSSSSLKGSDVDVTSNSNKEDSPSLKESDVTSNSYKEDSSSLRRNEVDVKSSRCKGDSISLKGSDAKSYSASLKGSDVTSSCYREIKSKEDSTSLKGSEVNVASSIYKEDSHSLKRSDVDVKSSSHKEDSTSLKGSDVKSNSYKEDSPSIKDIDVRSNSYKDDSPSLKRSEFDVKSSSYKEDSTSPKECNVDVTSSSYKEDSTSLKGSDAKSNSYIEDSASLKGSDVDVKSSSCKEDSPSIKDSDVDVRLNSHKEDSPSMKTSDVEVKSNSNKKSHSVKDSDVDVKLNSYKNSYSLKDSYVDVKSADHKANSSSFKDLETRIDGGDTKTSSISDRTDVSCEHKKDSLSRKDVEINDGSSSKSDIIEFSDDHKKDLSSLINDSDNTGDAKKDSPSLKEDSEVNVFSNDEENPNSTSIFNKNEVCSDCKKELPTLKDSIGDMNSSIPIKSDREKSTETRIPVDNTSSSIPITSDHPKSTEMHISVNNTNSSSLILNNTNLKKDLLAENSVIDDNSSSISSDVEVSTGDSSGAPIIEIMIEGRRKEKDVEEASDSGSEKSKLSVKQRVSEIMADAHMNDSLGDKSPRLQDLYVTTYDVITPEGSPELGSPVENKLFSPKDIYGNEAEELLRKQLAIEQEIKQLEQQQQLPYLYMREIPNKPPPPYTPPVQTAPILPPTVLPMTVEQISSTTPLISKILYKAHKANSLVDATLPSIIPPVENIDNDCWEFLFDLCKEYALEHYKQFEEISTVSWMVSADRRLGFRKEMNQLALKDYLDRRLRQVFEFEKVETKESMIIKWSRKKRDHVDELLVVESLAEEAEWTNYNQDELCVRNKVTNDILKLLLSETADIFNKIVAKKN